MKYKKAIVTQSKVVQEFILEKVRNSDRNSVLPNRDNKLINEGLLSIYKLIQNTRLAPHDKILLERTIVIAQDCVYSRLIYFGNFLRLRGDDKDFLAANVSVATMLSSLLGAKFAGAYMDGSTDDYFYERMPVLLSYLENAAKGQPHSPVLYLLFNLGQTLSECLILDRKDDRTKKLLKRVFLIQQRYIKQQTIKDFIAANVQLELFYKYQWNLASVALDSKKEKKTATLTHLPKLKVEYQLRVLATLARLNEKNFIQLFEENFDSLLKQVDNHNEGLNNILFLRCLTEYYLLTNRCEELELELVAFKKSLIVPENYLTRIFSMYSEAMAATLGSYELEILLNYDDEQLRERIANIILDANKNELLRERKKPHGGFEVADMEIQIKIDGNNFFLCMPFKSGREIKSGTVPENIAYQIFRPFIHYNNVIVIFITARRCSQNLMNYIKKMQNKLRWNIAVIENEELAKLLKINNQLN